MSARLHASKPFDSREFRNCCGRFATGITVVTTRVGDITHGTTVNGFMSVSLQPPLIVVSIGKHTRLHQFLPQSLGYGVSILDETQIQLSRHFAGHPDTALTIPFIDMASMPVLDGALAHLIARVVDMHEAGDHTLFIGEVEHLRYRDGRPLLYYSSSYTQLADDPKADRELWLDKDNFLFSWLDNN